MRKISNELYPGELTTIIFLLIFEDIASKFEKFPSLPSVVTDDRKQFQCGKIVFNNKARALFF